MRKIIWLLIAVFVLSIFFIVKKAEGEVAVYFDFKGVSQQYVSFTNEFGFAFYNLCKNAKNPIPGKRRVFVCELVEEIGQKKIQVRFITIFLDDEEKEPFWYKKTHELKDLKTIKKFATKAAKSVYSYLKK